MKAIILASKNFPTFFPKKIINSLGFENKKNATSLDWIIPKLINCNIKNIIVVTEKIKKKVSQNIFPNIIMVENNLWKKYGNLFTLSLGIKYVDEECLISYGDILFDNNFLKKILINNKHDFVIGYDSNWQRRYTWSKNVLNKIELIKKNSLYLEKIFKGEKAEIIPDGEFCGLLLTSSNGTKIISEILKEVKDGKTSLNFKKSSIIDLISYLIKKKNNVKAIGLKWIL